MVTKKRFMVVYHSRLVDHLRAIERKYHSLIHEAIETQLFYDPALETKNRKPVRQPFLFEATWEIRFGPNNCFRVFYEVDQMACIVHVLAIGESPSDRW